MGDAALQTPQKIAFICYWVVLGLSLQATLAMTQAKAGREQIVVIFTANLSGAWTDCGCEPNSGGGVVRVAAAVDSLRRLYPQAVLVDAGDFLSSFPRPGSDSLMLAAYAWMKYDAIGPGEYEFSAGPGILRTFAKWHLPIVAANLGDHTQPPGSVLVRKNHVKIGVVAVIDQQVFRFRDANQRPSVLAPWKGQLQHAVGASMSRADVIIGLVHGYPEMVMQAAKVFPPGSLIVQGHWHRLYRASRDGVRHIDGRTFVNPGENGEFIGLACRTPGEAPWKVSLIALNVSARQDTNLLSAVRKYLQQ